MPSNDTIVAESYGTMDAILVERRQSTCDTNTASAMRGAMATSSALKSQGSPINKHDKTVVRVLWVTQKYSSRDDNYFYMCVNQRYTSAMNATMKPGKPLNGKPQADWANSCPWSPTTQALGSKKTKTTSSKNSAAAMTHETRVTPATLTVQTVQASQLVALKTPSPDNKTSASSINNNSKYHVILVGFLK